MTSLEKFRECLAELIEEVPRIEANLRFAPQGILSSKPEEETKNKLLNPLLDALGFDKNHRTMEFAIRQSNNERLGWVDYRLDSTPNDSKGLLLLEAKSLLETKDLWNIYGKRTRKYLRDYQLALKEAEPVRWIVLTNFRELHVLNIADHEPFLKLTYNQYLENADLIFRLLNREQLINDQITSIYYEKRRVPLGKAFLRDLKLWRLLLANGLKQSQPLLSLEQTKSLSQQILDRIILIRVLETQGLHPYYSLVRQYVNWFANVRNHDKFPFFTNELTRTFDDIEKDLNTDLFKDTLMEQAKAQLKDAQGQPIPSITIANKYIRALIDPDIYWTDQDQDIRELIGQQTGQQRFAYSTPYNYDFHTLTQDIIGQVYEQFLAHDLKEKGQRILIDTDQSLRQREGTYYTPTPIVNFVVEGTVGKVVDAIKEDVRLHLQRKDYQSAQSAITRLRYIKIIDIACGSGTFLLVAYERLIKAYKWWNETLDHILAHDFEHDLLAFLDCGLRKERNPGDTVLLNSIFGIDRDSQAVEVAKLNLWLLLLRTQPEDYARRDGKPPKSRLPDISKNILAADALYPLLDIGAMLGTEPQKRIILGNPPWGADMSAYGERLSSFSLAKGQYDSYELFIERASSYLRQDDLLGYVVPDSILQPPEHMRLREHILHSYNMGAIVKLGEGVFEDVFRGAVAFIFARSDNVVDEHTVRCHIVVKRERQFIFKNPRENTVQMLLDKNGISITQSRFWRNKDKIFDIFTSDQDEAIIKIIDQNAMDWREMLVSGRGVEVSKSGTIMACSHCGTWQNIPRKNNDVYLSVICANTMCGRTITYDECSHTSIINPVKTILHTQPIIVGESINRYQIIDVRYLDMDKVKTIPKCPCLDPKSSKKICGYVDTTSYPFIINEVRTCKRCGQQYTEEQVKSWVSLGINYKSPELYAGEKLLVRKTGRGIYATIDRTGAYTNQVVFIFKLKEKRPEAQKDLRLSYVLGVLNSRMMLYRYYKALGDIEWKSFPYMTQDTIMGLPIRRIDFADARQLYLHNRIADLVDGVIESGQPPAQLVDDEIELCVRTLYGVEALALSEHIDAELQRISSYGSLLGSP